MNIGHSLKFLDLELSSIHFLYFSKWLWQLSSFTAAPDNSSEVFLSKFLDIIKLIYSFISMGDDDRGVRKQFWDNWSKEREVTQHLESIG